MGKRRTIAALLIAGACLAAGPARELPIREANWIAPSARAAALSNEPASCVKTTPDNLTSVLIGEVAFRTPFLLGGQAARAGLTCASCHRNGRGNPHFVFPGVSGPPGTADVTSSLLSSHRGDGVFNPKPIPDLATDPAKVSPDETRRFIRGLIVEEFDGVEPPARVLDGLVSYAQSLDAKHCGATAHAITLETSLRRLATALDAAVAAFEAGDAPTARLMTLAARSELGRIDERFAASRFASQRVKLDLYDRALRGNLQALEEQNEEAESALANAQLLPDLLREDLAPLEAQSLYNSARLKRALSAAQRP